MLGVVPRRVMPTFLERLFLHHRAEALRRFIVTILFVSILYDRVNDPGVSRDRHLVDGDVRSVLLRLRMLCRH